jgi:PKD repeat protein
MTKLPGFLIFLGIFLGLGMSCASAANIISFNPQTVEIHPGSSQNVQVVMDKVPKGLSGFNITISTSDPKIAEITAVSSPNWGMLPRNSKIPSSSIWIKTVDLNDKVRSGDSSILLGTITLTGKQAGTTDLRIPKTKMSDDAGSLISPVVTAGKANVVVNALKAPVAAFSASPTSGKAPLTVKFSDKSKGSPKAYIWNFGDKSTSTARNPVHKYSKAGKYTVSLTANNAAGSNTKKVSNYITVKSK